MRNDLTKEVICKKYVEEKKSINKISEELRSSHTTIANRLKTYGLEIRDYHRFNEFDKEFFAQNYVKNEKSSKEIAKEVGVSQGAILNRLRKHNIDIRKRESKDIKLTETQKAYIAGVIDGEGCICLYKSNSRHILCVSFTSTDKRLIAYLSKLLDWNFAYTKPKNRIWKTSYRLQAMDSRSERALKDILPYLIIKREQAELALRFRETYKIKYPKRKGIPKNIWDLRESQEKQMHILNKKGASNKPIEKEVI